MEDNRNKDPLINYAFLSTRGLIVNASDSESSCPGSSPGGGHCVVFSGKTLPSHRASLHPSVEVGTGELSYWGSPIDSSIPSRGCRNTCSNVDVTLLTFLSVHIWLRKVMLTLDH